MRRTLVAATPHLRAFRTPHKRQTEMKREPGKPSPRLLEPNVKDGR